MTKKPWTDIAVELPDNPEFYSKIPADFEIEIEGHPFRPIIYRPTAKGLEILVKHYREHYDLDIRLAKDSHGLLTEFLHDHGAEISAELLEKRGHKIGFLFDEGSHITPIIFSQNSAGKNEVIIFDSTPTMAEIAKIARAFPGFQFYLNKGVRQADTDSCGIDAVAILKDSLRIDDLFDIIKERESDSSRTGLMRTSRISNLAAITTEEAETFLKERTESSSLPPNLKLFLMPEALMKTAQRPKFFDLTNPDKSQVICTTKGKTLQEKLDQHWVDTADDSTRVNIYLTQKGYKFASIICASLARTPPSDVEPAAGCAVAAEDPSQHIRS